MFGIDEYTKLLLHANGDLSPSHHNLTYNGGVKLDYVATPVGSGAYYFDGTDDYISIPDSAGFDFGSGDFCIEACIKHSYLSSTGGVIGNAVVGGPTGWEIEISESAGNRYLKLNATTSSWGQVIMSSTPILDNVFFHFAIVRSSNAINLYLDGALDSTVDFSGKSINGQGSYLVVGRALSDYNDIYGSVHIADLQITKGEAKYTSNFTPPTTRAQPDANTVLLLSGSGDYGTTGHSITTYNGVKESSDSYKFASGAFYFDGTNDYLSVPDSDDWNFGSGDFAIDGWIKSNDTVPTYQTLIGYSNTVNQSQAAWHIHKVNDGNIDFTISNGSSWVSTTTTGGDINNNAWNHFACVRSGTDLYVFINGTLLGSGSYSGNIHTPSSPVLNIGRYPNSTAYNYGGYIDELRISKGIARWTSDFTPQDYEYGSSGVDTSINQDFQFEIIDTELEFDFDLYSFYNNEFLIYTKGYEVESGNIDIYTQGFLPHSGDFNLYSDGFDSFNIFTKGFDSMPIYAWGSVLDSGDFPYYSFGFDAMPIFAQGTKEGSSFYGETTETLNIVTSGTDGTILTSEFNIVASSSPPIEIYDSMPLFTPREIFTLNDDLNIFCNTHKAYPISSEFNIYTNAATSSGVFGQPFDSMNVFLYGYYSRTPRPVVSSNPSTSETQEQIDNSGSGDASFGLFAIGL